MVVNFELGLGHVLGGAAGHATDQNAVHGSVLQIYVGPAKDSVLPRAPNAVDIAKSLGRRERPGAPQSSVGCDIAAAQRDRRSVLIRFRCRISLALSAHLEPRTSPRRCGIQDCLRLGAAFDGSWDYPWDDPWDRQDMIPRRSGSARCTALC